MRTLRWGGVLLGCLASSAALAWPSWLPAPPKAFEQPVGALLVWQWIGFAAVGALSLLAGYAVFRLLAFLFRLNRHTRGLLASIESGRGVKRAAALLVSTFVFQAGALYLELPGETWEALSGVLLVVRILATGFIIAAIWDAFTEGLAHRPDGAHRARALLIPFAQKFGRFVLFSMSLLAAVGSLGYNVGAVIAGLGIGGVAIALAAKDSIENLFGTLTLVLDLPFGIGDWVKIGTVDGTVEEINLRSTKIRTVDDSLITLPNSNLIRASVENLGRRRSRRIRTELKVRNAAGPDELKEFCGQIREMVASQPSNHSRDALVHLTEVGLDTFSIQIECRLEVPDFASEMEARHNLLLGALELARQSGILLGPTPAPEPQPEAPAEDATPKGDAQPEDPPKPPGADKVAEIAQPDEGPQS